MKKLLIILLAASLGGCATQFGTRIAPPGSVHRHRIVTKVPQRPTPVVAAPAAAAPIPAPAPEKPKTFFQRHPIKWLH